MAFLVEAYAEDEAPNTKGGVDTRVVLKLDPRLAPVKAAVLPLSRNEQLSPKARDLAAELRKHWNVDFDDAGAIGRRYRRQDEIGTPFCITVDFDTLDDQAVTIRHRDDMTQERVALEGPERRDQHVEFHCHERAQPLDAHRRREYRGPAQHVRGLRRQSLQAVADQGGEGLRNVVAAVGQGAR